MNMVFPKVTKCTFHKYGPSGTVTRRRRTLHPCSQHHQREDLRVPLVLVCGRRHHVWSCHHLQNGRHSRSFSQGFCHLRACSQPGPAIDGKGAHYQQVRLARSGWRLLGDLLVVQEPQPHRNEGAFGGTQAGHGSRFKQLPTSLSFNGNGREGVQHVDEEKRERRKRGVKEEILRRRRHFRESESLWRGRTCCEIFFYRRLTIKNQRMCLAAAYTVPENAFCITNPAILISFLEK